MRTVSRVSLPTRLIIALLPLLAWTAAARPAQADSSLGFGLHAWRTVDDLSSEGFTDIRRDGISYLVSYLYEPGALLKFEFDGEYYPNGFGGATHWAVSPEAYVLLGGFFYGGLGVGATYSKDFNHNLSSPFYAARVGLNLRLIPKLKLDVNANYRFHAFDELKGADTGTVTLGAILRFGLGSR